MLASKKKDFLSYFGATQCNVIKNCKPQFFTGKVFKSFEKKKQQKSKSSGF